MADEGTDGGATSPASKLLGRAVAGAVKEKAMSSSEPLADDAPDGEDRPIQVVSINDEGTKFILREEEIKLVMEQIPAERKVALVSVVGAFRTGKSFLLTLILRYLDNEKTQGDLVDWNEWVGDASLDGNSNEGQGGEQEQKSFGWRGGRERNTTGIWLWSRPFMRKCPQTGEDIAVLLLDTQGMFDSSTTQMLTASIFGLSTLLSSYQIYNVKDLIAEDNLQHLALFSEYGRMALAEEQKSHKDSSNERVRRPFQRLDFLVRDYANFDDEEDDAQCESDAKRYLEEVFAARTQEDLANTREQITTCFETIGDYLLPHPGLAITKKNYDGSVEKIDSNFFRLLNRYLHRIFNEDLEPKQVHGLDVNARQLLEFVKAYVELFRDCTIFPEAKTLLDATAEANNRNAKAAGITQYKAEMDQVAAPKCKFVEDEKLEVHNKQSIEAAKNAFREIANMGLQSEIDKYEAEMMAEIANEWENYKVNNSNKDPYKNLEFYILPIAFAVASYFATYIVDACHAANTSISPYCGNIFWCVATFFIVMIASTGQGAVNRAKAMFELAQGS